MVVSSRVVVVSDRDVIDQSFSRTVFNLEPCSCVLAKLRQGRIVLVVVFELSFEVEPESRVLRCRRRILRPLHVERVDTGFLLLRLRSFCRYGITAAATSASVFRALHDDWAIAFVAVVHALGGDGLRLTRRLFSRAMNELFDRAIPHGLLQAQEIVRTVIRLRKSLSLSRWCGRRFLLFRLFWSP